MRKLLLSALISSGLVLGGISSFTANVSAQASKPEEEAPPKNEAPVGEEKAPPTGTLSTEEIPVTEVTGEVVNYDERLSTLTIKTPDGETMPLTVQFPDQLKDINPGDMVTVKVVGGAQAASITAASEEEGMMKDEDGMKKEEMMKEEGNMEEETAPASEQ